MNDREKLVEIFKSIGLGFTMGGRDQGSIIIEDHYDKVDAYAGFSSEFEFDENGKFVSFQMGE